MNSAAEAVFFVAACALTLLWLWRELPLQYVVTVSLITSGVAALGCFLSAPKCWWLPLIVLNSRGVSRYAFYQWRDHPYYGWWVMGLACVLSTLLAPAWTTAALVLLMQIACLPWLIKRKPTMDAPHVLSVPLWLVIAVWHFFNF